MKIKVKTFIYFLNQLKNSLIIKINNNFTLQFHNKDKIINNNKILMLQMEKIYIFVDNNIN